MIVAMSKERRLVIFGIDAENVKRLKEGKPILKALAQFGGPDIDVLIVYGDTLEDVKRELSEKMGFDLPPETPMPKPS